MTVLERVKGQPSTAQLAEILSQAGGVVGTVTKDTWKGSPLVAEWRKALDENEAVKVEDVASGFAHVLFVKDSDALASVRHAAT